jgi:hypothetical protein
VRSKTYGADTDIAENVVRDEVDDLVQFTLLLGLAGIKLPQAVQPGQLYDLLGEEEATNKVGLGRPERNVSVVDILHVWRAVQGILLNCKVIEERCWCDPFGGAVFNAHDCGMVWLR